MPYLGHRCPRSNVRRVVGLLLLLFALPGTNATPAFPGAEGAGANALGGRGGDVYYVTTLADNGPGSLREGINTASGPRTILFKVSGNIELNTSLTINRPRITLAGQTAPGDGICLKNYALNVSADDIVLRHIRSRLGTDRLAEQDAIWINAGNNIIADHCSTSWSVDETFSVTRDVQNFTMQWCYVTESLNNSIHSKGPHGYGGIISSGYNTVYSLHHNLYAHHNSRNPRLGSDYGALFRLDFRNNVIYDWGGRAGYSGGSTEFTEMNYVANYLAAGPSTSYSYAFLGGATTTAIYQYNNSIDLTANGLLDGSNTGWGMFAGVYTPVATPFAVPPVTTHASVVAYHWVLAQAGAMPWRRDPVDQRIAHTARTFTGQVIDGTAQVGGHPALVSEPPPVDSDADGMPDFWEGVMGLNTNSASDRNLVDAQGYTRLEHYLNWLAGPHAVCGGGGWVDVDLRTLNGGSSNLTYTVANGTNGTVQLLGDGYTARFQPAAGHVGLADFTFVAHVTGIIGFGPVSVGVLVTQAVVPPFLTWSRVPGGIELSWEGDWILQYRASDGAGGGAWWDFPDTNNPVLVPIDHLAAVTMFRLAPAS